MKISILPILLLLISISSPILAHDFWAGVETAEENSRIAVFIGFGHNFPNGDEISADQVTERYEPVKVLDSKGEIKLSKGNAPGKYVSDGNLTKGSYWVLTTTKAGFSSQTPEGYVRKSKSEAPTAIKCSYGTSQAKTLVTLGKGDLELITKPVGMQLEIVPQVDPATIKVGDAFPVKVLYEGSPLAGVSVGAFFAGFSEHNEALAFSQTTNKEGLVNIIPLQPGKWLAKASYERPYSNTDLCDIERYGATLVFDILK